MLRSFCAVSLAISACFALETANPVAIKAMTAATKATNPIAVMMRLRRFNCRLAFSAKWARSSSALRRASDSSAIRRASFSSRWRIAS